MSEIEITESQTRHIKTPCGTLHVTIGKVEGKPHEVFLTIGKAGGCASAQCEAIGRLLSWGLQGGATLEGAIHQLIGISCHQAEQGCGEGTCKVKSSCADSVAKVLKKFQEVGE
jgi:ribonucleoside-diphosphate reductase alpha chain